MTPSGQSNGDVFMVPTGDEIQDSIVTATINGVQLVNRAALTLAQKRLKLLAAATLSVLDAERARTGVDEWDESDQRCFLYNAATAIIEREANAAYVSAEAAEAQIDDCLDQAQ